MMYNLTGGDLIQIEHIRKNFTVVDLYKWIGIKNYVYEQAEKDK